MWGLCVFNPLPCTALHLLLSLTVSFTAGVAAHWDIAQSSLRKVNIIKTRKVLWIVLNGRIKCFYIRNNRLTVLRITALHRQMKQTSGGQFLGMESCKYSEKYVSESEDTNDSQVNRPVKRRGQWYWYDQPRDFHQQQWKNNCLQCLSRKYKLYNISKLKK